LSSIKKTPAKDLKLRVFAGPNGSGKSTVIKQVRQYKSGGIPIDFGYYVNADDITVTLNKNGFSFQSYKINVVNEEFQKIAIASGLINKDFTVTEFSKSYLLIKNKIIHRLKQQMGDWLRLSRTFYVKNY
jgi:predicted ABC-type ATPase